MPRLANYNEVLAALTREYRAANPNSRVVGIIKYVYNTSRIRRRGCVLCGEEGPSWCGDWPKTRRAEDWESEHEAEHVHANAARLGGVYEEVA